MTYITVICALATAASLQIGADVVAVAADKNSIILGHVSGLLKWKRDNNAEVSVHCEQLDRIPHFQLYLQKVWNMRHSHEETIFFAFKQTKACSFFLNFVNRGAFSSESSKHVAKKIDESRMNETYHNKCRYKLTDDNKMIAVSGVLRNSSKYY